MLCGCCSSIVWTTELYVGIEFSGLDCVRASRFMTYVLQCCMSCDQHVGVSLRCVFREMHAVNGFTEFQSVYNQSWHVGFNRHGRRLPGDPAAAPARRVNRPGPPRPPRRRLRRLRRCYQFIKTDFSVLGAAASSAQAPRQHSAPAGHLQVNWYSWAASRRSTDLAAVT